ncbi:MAG: efflux RND transporter permease subunit [Phycisphaerales bacterium]|nr:efflux RND transporter permease subunit [Phycisphaerales bacterium]
MEPITRTTTDAMLRKLIQISIDHAGVVLLAAGFLIAAVAIRIPNIPVDVFPELNAPTVVIMTESPGLAADEVEQFVTFPVETAVNGASGVRRVRTSSGQGLSIAWVEFDWGTDIYRARQLVSERLDTVRDTLPPDSHAELTPITSITGEIMLLAVSSPEGEVPPLDLRAWAEFDLRNRLLAVPGVAQIAVIGGELPEYQVLVEQDRLRLYDLTIADVIAAADASHSTLAAGYLPDVGGLELPIRQSGRVQSTTDIEGTLVALHQGSPVTIGQVADVRMGAAPKRGTGADGGFPAVILTVQKAPDTNTLVVTDRIDELLDGIEMSMPDGIRVNRQVFRQSDLINVSVDNVIGALGEAAIIVAIILLLFLINIRTTLITLTALPVTMAMTLLILDWMGESINVMTLGGLAIAVGSLVDDAIIDVENVFRRLRENSRRALSDQLNTLSIIFKASNEIRPAMVFATIIIALVFMPLMFLEGIEGRFFRPLGLAFMISILSSLLVALTVTPAMCRYLLGRSQSELQAGDGALVRLLKRWYEPVLRLAIKQRIQVLSLAGIATILSLWLGSTFGTSFLPEFREGTFTVGLFAPPGTSLAASNRIASAVEARLLQVDGVQSVTRRTGRAERDEHAEPVSNSEIEVTVKPGFDDMEVRASISEILKAVPGMTVNIGQPIQHRLSHILSGTPAAIAINVYGNDLHVLRLIAKEIEDTLKMLPGARDVAANRELMIQSMPIEYQPAALAAMGLTPQAAAEQVRAAVHGVEVDEINDGTRRYKLVVRLNQEARDSIDDIRNLVLRGSGGALVRLNDVAVLGPERVSNLIARENMQRKAIVSLNVADGHNLGDLIDQVRGKVDPIVQRYGHSARYGGQFEAQQSASRTIMLFGVLVLIAMFGLLHLAVHSGRVALLVMVNLPLSLIGGIIAIFIADSPSITNNILGLFGGTYVAPVISIASMVGFITLFGIAVRNGILLVNHYSHLMQYEGLPMAQAIVQGSLERLIPILMTALTAALALLPIVLQAKQPGNEILAPLSVVILGGLLSSTFLNLIVVPAGYALIHRGQDHVVP